MSLFKAEAFWDCRLPQKLVTVREFVVCFIKETWITVKSGIINNIFKS